MKTGTDERGEQHYGKFEPDEFHKQELFFGCIKRCRIRIVRRHLYVISQIFCLASNEIPEFWKMLFVSKLEVKTDVSSVVYHVRMTAVFVVLKRMNKVCDAVRVVPRFSQG